MKSDKIINSFCEITLNFSQFEKFHLQMAEIDSRNFLKKVEIEFDEEKPLDGVFHYLQDKYPNSVEVSVSSKTSYSDPESIIDKNSPGKYWESDSEKPHPWFQITFKDMYFHVIGYVLKATHHISNSSFPNSWILAGSNDGENWTTLAQVDNCTKLYESNIIVPFECDENYDDETTYNIFRFEMTEPTDDFNWIFHISKVELFGDLYINE